MKTTLYNLNQVYNMSLPAKESHEPEITYNLFYYYVKLRSIPMILY